MREQSELGVRIDFLSKASQLCDSGVMSPAVLQTIEDCLGLRDPPPPGVFAPQPSPATLFEATPITPRPCPDSQPMLDKSAMVKDKAGESSSHHFDMPKQTSLIGNSISQELCINRRSYLLLMNLVDARNCWLGLMLSEDTAQLLADKYDNYHGAGIIYTTSKNFTYSGHLYRPPQHLHQGSIRSHASSVLAGQHVPVLTYQGQWVFETRDYLTHLAGYDDYWVGIESNGSVLETGRIRGV